MNHVFTALRPPKRGMARHALTAVSCSASDASSTLPSTAIAARHNGCLLCSNSVANRLAVAVSRSCCIRSSTRVPLSRSVTY